jgi:signal transduction histidine kinase
MAENANNAVKEALKSLRNAVSTLKNPIEAELPLNYSIQRLAETFKEATKINVNLHIDETIKEDRKIKEAIYRTTQELLTNIKKHSNAKNVWLLLKKENNFINFSFFDD